MRDSRLSEAELAKVEYLGGSALSGGLIMDGNGTLYGRCFAAPVARIAEQFATAGKKFLPFTQYGLDITTDAASTEPWVSPIHLSDASTAAA